MSEAYARAPWRYRRIVLSDYDTQSCSRTQSHVMLRALLLIVGCRLVGFLQPLTTAARKRR